MVPFFLSSPSGIPIMYEWVSESRSVMSDYLWLHGQYTPRLLCPWNSPAGSLTWVAIPFSKGSSLPRDWTCISCIAARLFYHLSHQIEGSPSIIIIIISTFYNIPLVFYFVFFFHSLLFRCSDRMILIITSSRSLICSFVLFSMLLVASWLAYISVINLLNFDWFLLIVIISLLQWSVFLLITFLNTF